MTKNKNTIIGLIVSGLLAILSLILISGLFFIMADEEGNVQIGSITRTRYTTTPPTNPIEISLNKQEMNETIYYLTILMNDGNMSSSLKLRDLLSTSIIIKKSPNWEKE